MMIPMVLDISILSLFSLATMEDDSSGSWYLNSICFLHDKIKNLAPHVKKYEMDIKKLNSGIASNVGSS